MLQIHVDGGLCATKSPVYGGKSVPSRHVKCRAARSNIFSWGVEYYIHFMVGIYGITVTKSLSDM